MTNIVLIAHNLRSALNIGAILRTADGLGISEVVLSGYSPYPEQENDKRLPHERAKTDKQISKTALGAEKTQSWSHADDVMQVISDLKQAGFTIAALEQTPDSIPLPEFKPPDKLAIIVGREVEGIEPKVLATCDLALEIPMFGQKESYNVAQATAMALYQCAIIN